MTHILSEDNNGKISNVDFDDQFSQLTNLITIISDNTDEIIVRNRSYANLINTAVYLMLISVFIATIINKRRSIILLSNKNDELNKLKDQLEHKVGKRTKELEAANHELVRLNQVKSDFVSLVSHELRSPLTAIISFTDIMLDDVDRMETEKRKKYLSIIGKESNRLALLIDDILDLQKIASGKMNWHDEPTSIHAVCMATLELFDAPCRAKGLALTINNSASDALAMIDSDKFKQILVNLLANAIKFTEKGSIIIDISRLPAPSVNISSNSIKIYFAV